MASRSGWVTGIVAAHALYGASFLGMCIFLVFLTRQHGGSHSSSLDQAFNLAEGIFALLALVISVGVWGLAKNRLWGWWLALLTDTGLLVISIYMMIDYGLSKFDRGRFGSTVVAFVLVGWLFVPTVRRFYWAEAAPEGLPNQTENA